MIALVIAALVVTYVVVVVRTTHRRWERDLPLLRTGHEHQWTSVPGSAMDKCPCGSWQERRWTT